MPVDFDKILNSPLMAIYARLATITPEDGGAPYQVEMDHHADRAQVDLGGEVVQVQGVVHTAFLRLSTLPAGRSLHQGDVIAIGESKYTVAGTPAADETGWLAVNVYAGEVAADV